MWHVSGRDDFGSGAVDTMPDEIFYLVFLFGFYATTVVTYFALGFGLTWLNDRNPERKIQKGRGSGKRRKAAYHSPAPLSGTHSSPWTSR